MATLLKVLNNLADIKSAGGVALRVRTQEGAEGAYNFDEFGDGLHGYNIVRNVKGDIVFDMHIEFTD